MMVGPGGWPGGLEEVGLRGHHFPATWACVRVPATDLGYQSADVETTQVDPLCRMPGQKNDPQRLGETKNLVSEPRVRRNNDPNDPAPPSACVHSSRPSSSDDQGDFFRGDVQNLPTHPMKAR